ncbi:hypothetical protein NM688_g7291 [Phlebia brevispora]|uniref:Uncharacterized protein n=1 Tax=Phlebia brevispora TaxID=194682 RepID=A0ACC1S6Y3_9APHY|nr:hypothetical protein NM688_g7291 [Phlebia brevispora]
MSMDVDEEEGVERGLKFETIFAKSEELQVTFYAHLPAEVKLVLRNADFYHDAYTGEVDTETGFALIASAERCFVWNYSQALTGTPTCYIFGCPQDAIRFPMDTPFHALVPFGSAREPGLILISPEGQVHFWDSLGMGLAGGTHSSKSSLGLNEEERVTAFTRADTQTYIASTSFGRLFRLILTASGGKYHLSSHSFHRPASGLYLFRLFPTFGSSQELPIEGGNINAIAVTERPQDPSGKDVWALIDFRIQRWNMSVEGWEELALDEDVSLYIGTEISSKLANNKSATELDLEFLDLQVVGPEELLVLVSFSGQEDNTSMDISLQPRRIYAIVPLTFSAPSFEITSTRKIVKVPYQSTSSSGAPMHPRMQTLLEGELISIQFGDAVVLCSPVTEYTDRLELKSATDRTFGVGIIENEDENEFMILTSATLMKVGIDTAQIANFQPTTGRANIIKSTMTQAILYGAHPENPLHFSFPPDVDEEALMSGAEQLSQAIMESDGSIIRPNPDLQAQMSGRKDRLSFLIKFINDNGVLTKMSQRSRQRLATDAEKLYAAHQLWLRHNESLTSGRTHSVLSEAVFVYMHSVEEGYHEDLMRAFFRLKVQELSALLPHVMNIIRRSTHEITQSLTDNVPQANNIVLTIIQSALDYREYNLRVYGVELPMIDPWTSQPIVIDIISRLFDTTARLVESPLSEAEPTPTSKQAKAQLPELASILFSCYHEQLEWLASPLASTDPANVQHKNDTEEQFKQARPLVLETLRRNGFVEDAFNLAEMYRDFRSLATLCHKETVYPPQENPYAQRIQAYVDKFKEDFTTELFQWYIEHGVFFAEYNYPNVSWIHDIGRARYGSAAETLLHEASGASELSSKHLMLSIGKLSYLAQVQETESTVDEAVLDSFHDGLDFVSVHENLLEELQSVLTSTRVRQSLETQVDSIARMKASRLQTRKAFFAIFKQLVKRLLQGKALSSEDAADALSLKDNVPRIDDYITALHVLYHAELPGSRRLSAFRSVWRRIYLHDDWVQIRQTANVTDAEVNERFRNTALYAVQQSVISFSGKQPEGYALSPDEALPTPSQDEVTSRWPGMPTDDVAALMNDYEAESYELAALRLDDVVDRVRELAAEDAQWD